MDDLIASNELQFFMHSGEKPLNWVTIWSNYGRAICWRDDEKRIDIWQIYNQVLF